MSKLTYKQRIQRINEANIRYQKKAMTAFTIRYHNVNDADVIDYLRSLDNKNDFVRQAVRRSIKNNAK